MRKDFDGAREIVGDGVLEFFAPARSVGSEATAGSKINRRHIETGVETAAAVEADFLRIEFIEIVKDAADGETLIVVELLIEDAERDAAGVEHEVLAN